ncbi:MAG: sulfur carrier protein [Pseudohongiellaceae bacterium]|jgi:sulfur carrier protein
MTITINYNGKNIGGQATLLLTELLQQHANTQQPYAVAVNGTVVPRDKLDNVRLQQGDQIDVVSPIAGG